MSGNTLPRKSIDYQDIIAPPRPLHERQSVTYVTCDIPWQTEITLRHRERGWVNFNNRNTPPCSRQHGAKSAAAATDHEDLFPRPLQGQSIECMDVRIQTNAVAIGRALIAALLFVSKRAASFSEAKFDDTVFGSVLKRRRAH